MFAELSEQKELNTAVDCAEWWKRNREKYADVLNYKE